MPNMVDSQSFMTSKVHGNKAVRWQLASDPRTQVYVELVASCVLRPFMSYWVAKSNGVKVGWPRPRHAILPNGDRRPMDQHVA